MIRIFVGCPANNEDLESQAVLEWSLRKHASEPLVITFMKLSKDPASFWYSSAERKAGWLTQSWATPFSGFRWGIPAFCNFEGRAIYLDVDMIAMADIAELWNQEIRGPAFCIAKDQNTFCTTLWDCAKAKAHLPPIGRIKGEYALYAHLRRKFPPTAVQRFEGGNWNCLDGEQYKDIRDPDIKILHYTSIPTQPQLRYAVPRLAAGGAKHWSAHRYQPKPHWRPDIIDLFDEVLDDAKANGYPPERYATKETFGRYFR
jgi:hypothetical protein